ncbi:MULTISPECIES: hypothetical protein [unclassified Microbacterium]|uniref:hypothetical protein n=1 Tax=unclassified Microbacterium TaxID=2609290 RepID=UPI00364EC71D
MIGLWAGELRADWRSWAGLVLVTAVAGVSLGIGASFLETGMHAGGRLGTGISGVSSMILVFSGVSAIGVTSAVARLAVELGRAVYARWQLSGVTPRQVAVVVLCQVIALSLIGAGLGFAATLVGAPVALRLAFEGASGGFTETSAVVGPVTALFIGCGVLLIALLGGLPAARRAALTPALEALREPEPRTRGMRWWRWTLFGLMVVGTGAAVRSWLSSAAVAMPDDRNTLISQTPLIAPLLTLVIVAGGPVLYAPLLRGWTALLPARASSSWYLARHEARYHLGRSTASITPLFTGAAMLGGLYTVTTVWGAAARAAGEPFGGLEFGQVVVLLGGPLLLAGVGTAVVIFMSNRIQAREQALLSASGATDAVIVRAAVLQALIHVITAVLLALAVIAVSAVLAVVMLAPFYEVVPYQLDLGGVGVLVGVGTLLTEAAVLIPVLARMRVSVATLLSAV